MIRSSASGASATSGDSLSEAWWVRVLSSASGRDPRRPDLARLIITAGKRAGSSAELGDVKLSVGRLASCELPIEEPQASRKHFVVVRKDGDAWLHDLGSRNGTFL